MKLDTDVTTSNISLWAGHMPAHNYAAITDISFVVAIVLQQRQQKKWFCVIAGFVYTFAANVLSQ